MAWSREVVPAPGGVLIRDEHGQVIGAMGISGDVDIDEQCAIGAIEARKVLRADAGVVV